MKAALNRNCYIIIISGESFYTSISLLLNLKAGISSDFFLIRKWDLLFEGKALPH